MSPTVLRIKNYRFHFWANEESRMHVHIASPDGIAKFWLEPIVALDEFRGLNERQLREIEKIVKEHQHEIIRAWKRFFQS